MVVSSPHAIPIWLDVFGPRMLELVGRKADGWFPTPQLLAPEEANRKLAYIRKAAEGAGRNPDDITLAYNVPVLVEKGRESTRGQIAGNAAEVAKPLAEMIAHGFAKFLAGGRRRATARAPGAGGRSNGPRAGFVIGCACTREASIPLTAH